MSSIINVMSFESSQKPVSMNHRKDYITQRVNSQLQTTLQDESMDVAGAHKYPPSFSSYHHLMVSGNLPRDG